MPKKRKAPVADKRALAFAVQHKYRSFPVLRVVSVVAGNVLDLTLDLGFTLFKKERVQLSGIDAPGIRTKAIEEKQLGHRAKEALREMVDRAAGLEFVVDGKDASGRTTGVLFERDARTSVNQALMDGGFVWSVHDEVKDLDMLRALQGDEV